MTLVGTLNLCLEYPDTMQKKLAQSDTVALRKCPKHAQKLLFYKSSKMRSYFGKFLAFSQRHIVRFS